MTSGLLRLGPKLLQLSGWYVRKISGLPGGGTFLFDKDLIDERCIEIAFNTSEKLKAQCVAYDFVFDSNKQPLIVEINYGFAHEPYRECPGYWDSDLNWHEGQFNQVDWMVEEIINQNNFKV